MTTAVDDQVTTPGVTDAQRWLDQHGFPTGREEPWRYTPVDDIRNRLDRLSQTSAPPIEVGAGDLDRLAGRHGAIQVVFVDGVLASTLSSIEEFPGLRFATRSDADAMRQRLVPAGDPPDGFEAMNRASSGGATHLSIANGVELGETVHVIYVSTGARVAHPRLVVEVGAGSRLNLVETYVGAAGGGLTNASTTAHLAEGAHLGLYRVQDEQSDAVHVGRLEVIQQHGSHSEVTALSRGASISRLSTAVGLNEETASCRITGLLAPLPHARHDDLATVDHAASRCTSDLVVRSVVPEQARATSSGHVIVRAGTAGTVVQQRSDAILLDPTAQADSRPWLEILADDVRANHGSATGRLDDDALFYLRSRGVDRDEARRVLVGAFARAIVDQVEPPSLRAQIAQWFGWEADT